MIKPRRTILGVMGVVVVEEEEEVEEVGLVEGVGVVVVPVGDEVGGAEVVVEGEVEVLGREWGRVGGLVRRADERVLSRRVER